MKRKERQKQGVRVSLYIPRALLSPEELSKARAHANKLARERCRRDPERATHFGPPKTVVGEKTVVKTEGIFIREWLQERVF